MSELYKLSLIEARDKLQKKEISASELTLSCLKRIEETEPEINACISVLADEAKKEAALLDEKGPQKDQPLWGLPLGLKDNYCLRGTKTTCASKMLQNYQPPLSATVALRLKQAGAIILAKQNLDEFAMGSSTESSFFGPSKNPWNTAKVPGGSSGGSAAAVAAYQVPGAFASDTGGSIRQPASLCGCVGLKPTFGRVSRYGIAAFGSSFDQAGPLARRVADCALLLQSVAGADPKDGTASLKEVPDYLKAAPLDLKGLKLGIPEECWQVALNPEMAAGLNGALKKLTEAGAILVPIKITHLKYAVATYYILASAEASTNLARFDGVRYGFRAEDPKDLNDLYVTSRSLGFGSEVKRRILLGTFALSAGYYDAYFKKAAKVRRLIQNDYLAALGQCDFLLSPITLSPAWDFGSYQNDTLAAYHIDLLTIPANLSGLPALSLPVAKGAESGLPLGLQLIGRPWAESGLFSLGQSLENLFPPLL